MSVPTWIFFFFIGIFCVSIGAAVGIAVLFAGIAPILAVLRFACIHVVYRHRNGVLYLRPLNLAEQSGDRYRDVGEHEEREGEERFYLSSFRGEDLVPLRNSGDHTDRKVHYVNDRDGHGKRTPEKPDMGVFCADRNDEGDHVVEESDHREEYRGHGRHGHVECGESAFSADALHEPSAVIHEYLKVSLSPSETLLPRLRERLGLFVVKHCVRGVCDLFSVYDVVHGEFDVLGEKEVFPAVVFVDYIAVNHEARARYRTACAENHAGIVEVDRFAQEPKRISGGNPVRTVVL